MKILNRDFYDRSPLLVALDLLSKILVRQLDNQIISGRIVEVEAYLAAGDEASHSFKGITKRNSSMFEMAGCAYIYSIHQQICLNIVTEGKGVGSAVLIRALEPIDGIELMKKFRNKTELKDLTSGPGKLAQALQIKRELDGLDITDTNSGLYIIDDDFLQEDIVATKRIGISKAMDNDFRFYISGNKYISRK